MSNYAKLVLNKCLKLEKKDRFLIVTDSKLYSLSKDFFMEAEKNILNDCPISIRLRLPRLKVDTRNSSFRNLVFLYSVISLETRIMLFLSGKLILISQLVATPNAI